MVRLVSTSRRLCERCGRELPPGGPVGVCLVCTLERAEGEPPPEAALPLDLHDLPLTAGPLPQLPGYEFLDRIGRGGAGVVYRARQTRLGRMVAVKFLTPHALADEAARRRFQMEAHAVAQLQHPGIVAVMDAGTQGDEPYLVMEYVAGGDLSRVTGGRPLDPERAARLVQRTAQALQFAHEKGILHRDLKPSNILLDSRDQPRLTDFGLAKRLDADPGITLTGQTLGSPGYIPPEQTSVNRGQPGPASDVYSLGAVLYYLLTGRPPFLASTLADTLHEVLHKEPVAVRQLNPSVPSALETICLKCLEKHPDDRYLSAADVAADLGRFLAHAPVQAHRPPPWTLAWRLLRSRPATTALAMAALLVLSIAAGLGVWMGQSAREDARAARTAEQAAESRRQALDQELLRNRARLYASHITGAFLAWQQGDARQAWEALIACPESDAGWEYHYLHNLFTRFHRTFRGHGNMVTSVAFSPDGRRLVSTGSDGTLQVIEAATGRVLDVLQTGRGRLSRVICAREGTPILVGSATGLLIRWDQELTAPNLELRVSRASITDLALHPDGARLAVATRGEGAQLWDLAEQVRQAHFPEPQPRVSSLDIDPDGLWLASGGSDGSVLLRELESGRTRWKVQAHEGPVSRVTFHPTEPQLLSAGDDGRVRLWNLADGAELRSFKASDAPLRDAVFNPNGRLIATGGPDLHIRLWPTDAATATLVLRGHTGPVSGLAFSPDGHYLASAGRDHTVRLWDLAAASRPTGLSLPPGASRRIEISPDGVQFLCLGEDGRTTLGCTTNWASTRRLSATDATVTAMAFNPLGRQALVGTAEGETELWDTALARPIQRWTGHVGAIRSVAWAGDGQRCATAGDDGRLHIRDLSAPTMQLTLPGHPARVRHLVFLRDGRTLVSAGDDRFIRTWDIHNRLEQAERRRPHSGLLALRDTPEGFFMIRQDDDRLLWLQRLDAPAPALQLAGETLPRLRAAQLTADGRRLFAVGERSVFIWDTRTQQRLLTLGGHPAVLTDLALSDDQRCLLIADGRGRVESLDATPAAR